MWGPFLPPFPAPLSRGRYKGEQEYVCWTLFKRTSNVPDSPQRQTAIQQPLNVADSVGYGTPTSAPSCNWSHRKAEDN